MATLGILLVVTLIAFEGMSVGAVMPQISEDLNALNLYGLSFSAFLIASLSMNVVAGLWADRRGYPVPFLAGVVLFALGMALAGAASSATMFLVARAVQGFGGGAAIVALFVMIARVYPVDVRPKAFAAVSAAWVVPAMIGPSIAGTVGQIEPLGWRYVFYGIVPLVVPALAMLVPALRMGAATRSEPGTGPRSRPGAMALAAAATAGGAGLLLHGVDRLHVQLPSAIAETAAGLAFLIYGLYRLLPPGSLRLERGLPTTVLMRGFFSASFFGVNAFIPLALQDVKSFGITEASIALTTGALGWSAGSFLQSRRTGEAHKRMRLSAGCITVAILVCMLCVLPGVSGWIAVPAWILAGFGMGFGMTTVSITAMKQSPVEEQGANSASLSVTDQLGSALTIGIGGALVNAIGHSSSQIATAFLVISVLMAVIAFSGALLAFRTR
ncbi:MFS transporter [Nonomuraea sp. NPDC050404]|uniref:MFS transporter n=1 Tax=Nonomuraea sp. NPDC050404 TaxID=3155783 RepID=UPI00340987D8